MAAIGATAWGNVGDVVKVTIGITNKGPDQFHQWNATHQAVTWWFNLPPGTVTVPGGTNSYGSPTIYGSWAGCSQHREGEPYGVGPYDCLTGPSLEPGESTTGTFWLKITKVIPNATGTVGWIGPKSGGQPAPPHLPADTNGGNDEASVIINPDRTPIGQ